MRKSAPLFVTLLGVAFSASSALASDIVVTDCNANLRAQEKVEVGTTGKVVVHLNAKQPSSTQFSLVNKENKEAVAANSVDGTAVTFDKVPSGTWAFCPSSELSAVEILAAKDSGSSSALTIGAIGGGIAGAVALVASGSGSSNTPGSPATGPVELAGSGSGTTVSAAPPVAAVAEPDDCFVGEEPAPVSPLS